LQLTQFRGHIILGVQGVAQVQSLTFIIEVGQAAIDSGKPVPGKEDLISTEHEELVELRRLPRYIQ
jgi:hypothetical protein